MPQTNIPDLENSQRTLQIAKIIEKRKPLAKNIDKLKEDIKNLSERIIDIEKYRDRIMVTVEDESVTGRLKEINFSKIKLDIVSELESLEKLRNRFSRDTLNIGVIGRARQGKSRLLQSLTGLTAAEIPDGSGLNCTGVRSTIHHNPAVGTYGEVLFYTERTFLDEVIAPYYEQLNLGNQPITLDEFANKPLPTLPSNLTGSEVNAKYNHLRRYRENLDKYLHLLRGPAVQTIRKDQIREYVAQDNLQGERIYFNYLAVREVKIVCNFPKKDVGQIALVDLPGLGDTGIGDEKKMVQTIAQDIDAVLFVRKPNSTGDIWADVDVKLYDTASGALVDLPLELWSFMTLNKLSDGSNSELCQSLKKDITNQHINVVECIVANCADEGEANSLVLDKILDYLADNITSLDRQYASSCEKRLKQIQSVVNSELEKAKKVLGQAKHSGGISEKFEVLFDQLWNELTGSLEKLLAQLSKQSGDQDRDFKKSLEETISACYNDTEIIPSEEKIESRRDREKSYEIAYNQYLNEIRAHLSQQFLSLDDGLKTSMERLKSQVADVLIKYGRLGVEDGRLGGLTKARGSDLFKEIGDCLPEEIIEGEPSKIKFGFQLLDEFKLSYRGMIQHRIRKCLNGLTPDKTSLKLTNSADAEQVKSSLKVLYEEAVYACEQVIKELLSEPSQAAFAIVEEFIDRVLRAEKVQMEWRIFLSEERSSIWPAEFELLGERTRLRLEWQQAVERAATANQLESMQLLK